MPTVVSGVTSGGGSGSSGEPLLAAHILTYHAPLATINAMTSATTGASNQATSALTVAGNTSTNLQTHTATYHVANSVITALQASDTTTAAAIAAIDTSIGVLDGAIAGVTSVIGLPDGLAQLDTNGVIPRNQLPTVMSYKGSYDIVANLPVLQNPSSSYHGVPFGALGDVYMCTSAGTRNFGGAGNASVTAKIGDLILYTGIFTVISSGGSAVGAVDGVTSFNGRTGAIVPDVTDYNSVFLSLGGGTLTGNLSGTTAGFSGAVQCSAMGTTANSLVTKAYVDANATTAANAAYVAGDCKINIKGPYDIIANNPTLSNLGYPRPAPSLLYDPIPIGECWLCITAGSRDYNGGVVIVNVGDWIVYSGTRWDKLSSGAVISFNGRTGAVMPNAADYIGIFLGIGGGTLTGNLIAPTVTASSQLVVRNTTGAAATVRLDESSGGVMQKVMHYNGVGGSQTTNAYSETCAKYLKDTYWYNAAGGANLVQHWKFVESLPSYTSSEHGFYYGQFSGTATGPKCQLFMDKYGVAAFSGDVQCTTMGAQPASLTTKTYVDTAIGGYKHTIYVRSGGITAQTATMMFNLSVPITSRVIAVRCWAPSTKGVGLFCRYWWSMASITKTTDDEILLYIGDTSSGFMTINYYMEIVTIPNSACTILAANTGFIINSAAAVTSFA